MNKNTITLHIFLLFFTLAQHNAFYAMHQTFPLANSIIYPTQSDPSRAYHLWPMRPQQTYSACLICNEKLTSYSDIKAHMATHNTIKKQDPKPAYTCPTCNKNFNRKPGFAKHIKRHTDELPYENSEQSDLDDEYEYQENRKPSSKHVKHKKSTMPSKYTKKQSIYSPLERLPFDNIDDNFNTISLTYHF
jgi:hypothetical protein